MSILVPKSQERDSASTLLTDKFTSTKIGLIQTDLSPDPETALADLVAAAATFDGYAQKTSQTFTMIEDDAALVKLVSPQELWTLASDAVTGNTIYGYYVTNTAGSTLLFWEKFTTGQPMARAGDTVAFCSKYEFPTPTGLYVDLSNDS